MRVKNPVWDLLIESPFNKILLYSSLPKVGKKQVKLGGASLQYYWRERH